LHVYEENQEQQENTLYTATPPQEENVLELGKDVP